MKSVIFALIAVVIFNQPACANKLTSVTKKTAFVFRHPIKTCYAIGEWNDRTHFGSFLGLLGSASMITLTATKGF